MIQNNKGKLLKIREMVLGGLRPFVAIGLALIVSAVIILMFGSNPITAYAALLKGAIGDVSGLANTGVRAAPLLLGGLGVAFAFRAGLLNIGIEGQLYIGAIAATAVGITPLPIPAPLHIALAVIAGFLGGAVWMLIPGLLKAYRGVSEIVVTLMMNYVGIYLASYFVHGPLAEADAFYPQSPPILASARLPILIEGTSLHGGLILGVVLGIALFFILQYTPFGFRTRLVGANSETARYAGINIKKQLLLVLLISGGLGGLAGAGEILGLKGRFFDLFSNGLGSEAIAVALLANSNPIGVIISALFFGALKAGANNMQQVVGIETSIVTIIQALSVLFVIGIGFINRIRKNPRQKVTSLDDNSSKVVEKEGAHGDFMGNAK